MEIAFAAAQKVLPTSNLILGQKAIQQAVFGAVLHFPLLLVVAS